MSNKKTKGEKDVNKSFSYFNYNPSTSYVRFVS